MVCKVSVWYKSSNMLGTWLVTVLLFSIPNCMGPDGEDGQDGTVYIALWWADVNSIWFSDPAIPSVITVGNAYRTTTGTYQYQYTSWDNSQWAGTYTIYSNEGTKGKDGELFGKAGEDGEDGDPIWFEICLYSTGPTLYAWDSPSYLGKTIPDTLLNKAVHTIPNNEIDYDKYLDNVTGQEPPQVLEVHGDKYSIRLEYYKVQQEVK